MNRVSIYQRNLRPKQCVESENEQLKAENDALRAELDAVPTACEVLMSKRVSLTDLDDVVIFEGADISECLDENETLPDLDDTETMSDVTSDDNA